MEKKRRYTRIDIPEKPSKDEIEMLKKAKNSEINWTSIGDMRKIIAKMEHKIMFNERIIANAVGFGAESASLALKLNDDLKEMVDELTRIVQYWIDYRKGNVAADLDLDKMLEEEGFEK